MESVRRAYGIAEPVRRGMELKIVRDGEFRPAVLGGVKGGDVHGDILPIGGRDTEVGWEDVFGGLFFPSPFFPFIFGLVVWVGADLVQVMSLVNPPVSMMRWRRDCGWNFRFLSGWLRMSGWV